MVRHLTTDSNPIPCCRVMSSPDSAFRSSAAGLSSLVESAATTVSSTATSATVFALSAGSCQKKTIQTFVPLINSSSIETFIPM